jgi:N-dimethylarginine dimethylaminohydrolase
MTWPTRALMVDPQFFDVEYAINPHMLNDKGELNKVDKTKAMQQWTALKDQFVELGLKVEVLPGVENLPDMVFCANQTFPFLRNGELNIVLSQMHSDRRQPEVVSFRDWAEKNNIMTHTVKHGFEGMGDALWNYETGEVFGGYGFRTRPEAYTELETIIEQKITTFELKDERFYHLDTCLGILKADMAAYVPEAFTDEGIETLKASFRELIEIPIQEASTLLAGNLCTPNGKDVLIQAGADRTNTLLSRAGFTIHEMQTDEFIKSGGSVFCMKMLLP